MRANEAFEASDLLKCKTHFFDLKELNFLNDYKKKKIENIRKSSIFSNKSIGIVYKRL